MLIKWLVRNPSDRVCGFLALCSDVLPDICRYYSPVYAFIQTTNKSQFNKLLNIKCAFSWKVNLSHLVWVFQHDLTVNLNYLCCRMSVKTCCSSNCCLIHLALNQKQVSMDLKVSVCFHPRACQTVEKLSNLSRALFFSFFSFIHYYYYSFEESLTESVHCFHI